MRTETINFRDFMKGNVPAPKPMVSKKFIITTCLIAGALVFGIIDPASAATATLDEKAKDLYFKKFLGIDKWIIVGKGGWDTVNKTIKEDFDGAKKSFLQYLLVFGILYALPFGLDQVESVFSEE